MEFITLKELSDLRRKCEPIIKIIGIEFYRLELERMFESGYKFIAKGRKIYQLHYSTAQNQYSAVPIAHSGVVVVTRGRFHVLNADGVNRLIGKEVVAE